MYIYFLFFHSFYEFMYIVNAHNYYSTIFLYYYYYFRESQRDMFDQMNKNLQNIIITASVLFAALTTIITQGELDNPTEYFLVFYSIFCSMSFLGLFMSIGKIIYNFAYIYIYNTIILYYIVLYLYVRMYDIVPFVV